MAWDSKIADIQRLLAEQKVDGWLLYDYHGSNRFARQILSIPAHQVLTRPFFYWIPREGTPHKIVHHIEADSLSHLPGTTLLYLSRTELEKKLSELLSGVKSLLMEYSPRALNPNTSVVDAGSVEMVREMGVEVRSSADLLQQFTSVLTEEQIQTHLEAARVLIATVAKAWDLIVECLRHDQIITEYEVQQWILSEFAAQKCLTEEGPICAVNVHTAQPHYSATRESALRITQGDFILIDLWCKRDLPDAIYADITRVGVAAAEPTPRQQQIFDIVKNAQQKGIDFVRSKIAAKEQLRGSDVDDVCRQTIQEAGFGPYFTHRTGHNIDRQVHGAGANLDNLETRDHRPLLPNMCFSIEPGIYLPGEFGIRLESDLLILQGGSVQVTGGQEENIICLL